MVELFYEPLGIKGADSAGKTEEILERLQLRASKSIKLGRARNQFNKAEQEHQELLTMQRQTREREARERCKMQNEERMKAEREEDAKWREAARAGEDAYRKAEESRTEAAKEAREGEVAQDASNRRRQETERRERDLRQHLRERMAKQNAETKIPQQDKSHAPEQNKSWEPEQNQNRTPYSTARQTGNGRSWKKQTFARQTCSAGSETKVCLHDKFWPKVRGKHQCSVCSEIYNGFILQCPNATLWLVHPVSGEDYGRLAVKFGLLY